MRWAPDLRRFAAWYPIDQVVLGEVLERRGQRRAVELAEWSLAIAPSAIIAAAEQLLVILKPAHAALHGASGTRNSCHAMQLARNVVVGRIGTPQAQRAALMH